MSFASTNPATGEVVREFPSHTTDEIEARIQLAHDAYQEMKATDFATRNTWMHKAADIMAGEADELAPVLVQEMGKTLAQARAEILKSATTMRFYADKAEEFLAPSTLEDPSQVGAQQATSFYEPMGVVLAVMPWNYPIWQVVRFAAPALMAGNAALLKHASNVPQSALYLDSIFARGGFPEGAFSALLIRASGVEAVIRDRRIAAVTLTGSEPAGRSVAEIGRAHV